MNCLYDVLEHFSYHFEANKPITQDKSHIQVRVSLNKTTMCVITIMITQSYSNYLLSDIQAKGLSFSLETHNYVPWIYGDRRINPKHLTLHTSFTYIVVFLYFTLSLSRCYVLNMIIC